MEKLVVVRGVCLSPVGKARHTQIPRGGIAELRFLQERVGGSIGALPIRYVGDGSTWGTIWFNEEAARQRSPGISPALGLLAPLFVVPVSVLLGTVVITGRPTPDGDLEPIDDLVEQVIARHLPLYEYPARSAME